MPERTFTGQIRDYLTSPLRVAPALWEAYEVLQGRECWASVNKVLFHPGEAKPEDLQTFSERFLHVDNPLAKFAIDTVTDPLVFLGMAMPWGARKFASWKPGALANPYVKKAIEDFSGVTTYGRAFRDYAPELARVEAVSASRQQLWSKTYVTEYEKMIQEIGGKKKWDQIKHWVWLKGEGQSISANAADSQLVDHAIGRIRGLMDEQFDRYATQQTFMEKGTAHAGTPLNYLSDYFPRMMKDGGTFALNQQDIDNYLNNLSRTSSGSAMAEQIREMQSLGMAPKIFMNPAEAARAGQNISGATQQFLNTEGGKGVFNPYRLKRTSGVLDRDLLERYFVGDIDTIFREYTERAGRSWALTTPLNVEDAMAVHGKVIDKAFHWSDVEVLNKEFRLAKTAGNEELAAQISEKIGNLSKELRTSFPDQVSPNQLIWSKAKELAGLDLQAGYEASLVNMKKYNTQVRGKMISDWYDGVLGRQNPERWWTTKAMANVYKAASNLLDGPTARELDRAGSLFGKKNLGRDIRQWLTESNDIRSIARQQRAVVNYVYGTTMGFRPAAIVVNLLQPAITGYPTIGFGNLLHGTQEATKRTYRTLREYYSTKDLFEDPHVAWASAAQKHMPEVYEAGLITGIREADIGASGMGKSWLDRAVDMSMMPFATSEMFNRATMFYGSKRMWENTLKRNPQAFGIDFAGMAAKHGLQESALRNHMTNFEAAQLTRETQFVPSASMQSPMRRKMGPIGGQFMNYPIGFTNWWLDAGFRGALDAKAEVISSTMGRSYGANRSWLPYARWLAVSSGISNFSKDVLGTDLGERSMAGIINLPNENSPFAPLPLPPIPGAIAGVAQSLVTGDPQDANMVELPFVGKLPIPKAFVPLGSTFTTAARWLNHTSNGMVQDEQGRGVEDFDRKHAVMQMLGFFPVDSARDKMKTQQFLGMSEKVKEYRHAMARGIAYGDMNMVSQAQQGYAQEFKGAPPLAVSRSDVERVIDLGRTTRLQRVVGSMPRELRYMLDPTNPNAQALVSGE